MKRVKRIFIIVLILTAVGFLFRACLYRSLVSYKSIGNRTCYRAQDKKLISCYDSSIDMQTEPDVEQIIRLGLSITSQQLNFTTKKNDVDPNKLIRSKTAHCVGYASFCATTCNYLLKKYKLADKWRAKPRRGQLYVLGINIHTFFDSPFLKDHDFVIIENKATGAILAVDPTVNDYLGIDFVRYAK